MRKNEAKLSKPVLQPDTPVCLAGHSGLFRPDTLVGPDTPVGTSQTLRCGFPARVLERKSSPSGHKSAKNWPNRAGKTQDKAGPTP